MKQNIYDDENFFSQYEELREGKKSKNANDLIEIPNFRKLVPNVKNKSILDLGCGYGENDKYYKEKGAKYVLGTDISKKMIKKAKEEYSGDGIDYKVLAMEDISKLNKKFDIIISSLAFHYIKDYDKLIQDCYNLLNEGGYLVFSQEHPFTTCVKFTKNVRHGHMELDGKYYGLFSDYNRPGKRSKEWFGGEVIKYHRSFEEVFNTLIKRGFTIDKISEPKPSKEAIKIVPKYVHQYDRPYYLFVRAKKK